MAAQYNAANFLPAIAFFSVIRYTGLIKYLNLLKNWEARYADLCVGPDGEDAAV